MKSTNLAVCMMFLALGCAGSADDGDPVTELSVVDAGGAPAQAPADAGAPDAAPEGPLTTCCRLDNERGERLNYLCSEQLDVPELEGEGYRCWLVQ